jgi:hypothetical protein
MTLARGDQIYVMREVAGVPAQYQHHGIDCGDQSVIHYSKAGEVATILRTAYDSFSWGNPVYLVDHDTCFIADVVIERAESRLGEQRYDLFFNNCEHFATWCKTGRNVSAQLTNFGFRPERINLPEFRQLAERTAQERSPEQAMALFQQALGDIAIAYRSTLQAQQQAQSQVETWQQVAQAALHKNREDLARAALQRKVTAQKRADALSHDLTRLVDMHLSLERNRGISEQRYLFP